MFPEETHVEKKNMKRFTEYSKLSNGIMQTGSRCLYSSLLQIRRSGDVKPLGLSFSSPGRVGLHDNRNTETGKLFNPDYYSETGSSG